MNTWIKKDGSVQYHYHTSHRAICHISDVLQDVAKTHHTAENPDVKCRICKGILRSRGFFRTTLEKNRNDVREAKFLQKYKESPVSFMVRYLASPENHHPTTIQKIRHELENQFDGINVHDILADAIIQGRVTEDNGNFYPKCNGEIIL